jgi:drug/metabolite transporter (DMT)-like permease
MHVTFDRLTWTPYGPTALFVLLWGSGAIFARWGLDHASAFMLLALRFAIALGALLVYGLFRRRWLPVRGMRGRVALTGLLLIGGYSICYFQALDHGVTPGVLATVLGVQPILTLLLFERRFSMSRLLGLVLALGGLVLVVYESIGGAPLSLTGMLFALAALGSMTVGAILQKGVSQAPAEVLPLQYAITLLPCLAFLPFQPFRFEPSLSLLVPLLWLGLVFSVIAQLLYYRLIQACNLVNVTSLFYLVPVVTAAMDYLFLGNRMPPLSLVGMGAILLGLKLVFTHASAPVESARRSWFRFKASAPAE